MEETWGFFETKYAWLFASRFSKNWELLLELWRATYEMNLCCMFVRYFSVIANTMFPIQFKGIKWTYELPQKHEFEHEVHFGLVF